MDGTRRARSTVSGIARQDTARKGRHAVRVIGLALVTAAMFCILSGSALAARPHVAKAARPHAVEGQEFAIEKFQRIAGEDQSFTTDNLTAEVGQTVEYEIVVTNTSASTLYFSPLEDLFCRGISPDKVTALEPGESESFTCSEELSEAGTWENWAEIEGENEDGGVESLESNTVVVEAYEPEFSVEKLQRIKGSDSSFTTEFLEGTAGETIEYEIIVTNEGEIPLKVSPLQDANCTNISPAGATEVDVAGSATFTCEHTLAKAGESWTNQVTVQSGSVQEASNAVEAMAAEEPEFTIQKSQRVEGTETPFTGEELTAKLGQTIDYQIVVSNTGNRRLAFSELVDPNCTGVTPAQETELEAGESKTFTCSHVLESAGSWSNVAEIEGRFGREEQPEARRAHRALAVGGVIKKATSNKVVANVPAEPNYEIEKLQAISGSGAAFTKAELQGAAGQTVEYEVIVRNTGNVPLKLSALADANCTGLSPAGATEVAVGGSETFTCERALTGAGSYANEATIEGDGLTKTSNRVVLTVPGAAQQPPPVQVVQAKCTLSESLLVLHGASGAKHSPFTVHISALGIKQITFYLDGHKLKTLNAAQARKGQFSVRIDPAKLHYGAHRVSVTTVMSESACAAIARSAVFVHPHPAVVKPKFTG